MELKNLLFEVTEGIATVTINRPRALNALNSETWAEIGQVFAEIETRDDIKAVIVTGAGRVFVAGADVTEFLDLTPEGAKSMSDNCHRSLDNIANLSKPVIAAINGLALGGGCELAMACHIRVASQRAQFGQPEVGLGVIPGAGGTQRLARLIGKGRGLYYLLTGENIKAEEAHRLGLVNMVVPSEELMRTCLAIARVISQKGPVAVKLVLNAVNNGLELPMDKALDLEAELLGQCAASEDFKEGAKSFVERRPPVFKGK